MPSERRAQLRGLYAITPEMLDTGALRERVSQCLAGGAAIVQYRAKNADDALALEQARALAVLCRKAGALFIVNDSIRLALASHADGVHVGRDDAGVAEARGALPHAIVGASCYDDPAMAAAAARAGADYVAIGSVFASPSKPQARRAPLERIGAAAKASGLPVAAIGGIDLSNARLARDAGADMLAVISAVFDAPDVEAAARAFANLYDPQDRPLHARTQPRAV
ncbi:MAG TPA: thiamine phosphate synthase [Usitatibacter sp.]|nr:thiamine phosphate synthase [Usitatibacter sp.]